MEVSNGGILISKGSKQIVVDGFYRSTYPQFENPPSSFLVDYGNKIDLILASHIHSDHYSKSEVIQALESSKAVAFLNTQILDDLRKVLPKSIYDDRIVAHDNKVPIDSTLNGIKIQTIPITHSGKNWGAIENTAHIVEIENDRILHVGDPDPFNSEMEHANLNLRDIDIAVLPYWFFITEESINWCKSTIDAKKYIANHIPHRKKDEIRKALLNLFPELVIFDSYGEKIKCK
ncbi:MAG: hypothetical protein Tsb0034_11560 [Ekhidna sp.]